ncbi:MAG: homoserine kinase [Shinella sp.]|nr:MAG: homoserine kinase [Shinella sp.]
MTADLQQSAEIAASSWPQITGRPELVMQRENIVFRVQTLEGDCALRLHRPGYRSREQLQSELAWMSMLAAAGMDIPAPLPAADASFLVEGDRAASLLKWLPGIPLGRAGQPLDIAGATRNELFRSIGRTMATVHDLSDLWPLPAGFSRPRWDRDGLVGEKPLWGRFWEADIAAEDRVLFLRVRDHARELLAGMQADIGLIHADLVRENMLVQGDTVRFIDFDDSGFGYRIFDLATALLQNINEPDYAELQAALCEGYAERRSLPDIGLLPLFLVLRALTYVGWAADRMSEPAIAGRMPTYLATSRKLIELVLPDLAPRGNAATHARGG